MNGSLFLSLIIVASYPVQTVDEKHEIEWLTSYRESRKQSKDLNIPIFIEVTGNNCFYCKKMNLTTLSNSTVVNLISKNFISLKLDSIRDREIAMSLGVRLLPTFIIADPQGSVISSIEGFSPTEEFKIFIINSLAKISVDYDSSSLFAEATTASGKGDVEKAKMVLQRIVKREPLTIAGKKAEALLAELEQTRNLQTGNSVISETKLKNTSVPGSLVSRSLKNVPEYSSLTTDLLEKMQTERRSGRLIIAHDLAQQIKLIAPGTAAENDAQRLIDDSLADPQALKQLVEAQSDRLANLLFQSAETAIKQGQPQQAVYYLERILQIFPSSKYANTAQIRLAQIQGPPAVRINVQTTP